MQVRLFLFTLLFAIISKGNAQDVGSFMLEANYGMQVNYFVRSYNETGPIYHKAFFNKNALGTMGGADLTWKIAKNSSLGIGFAQTVNSRKINNIEVLNGFGVSIVDFTIRHTNNMYVLFYDHKFERKKINWNLEGGVCYVRSRMQEIEFPITRNSVLFEERNVENSGMEEAGVFAGLKASWKIDSKFRLGIRSRIFYLASVNTLECISLTPTLSYNF